MNMTGAFSKSIESYLNYTRMPWGRLFYQTAWHQIDKYFIEQSQSILDIGCGFGITSGEYAMRGNRVTGIEPTMEMISIARQNSEKASFICDSFENIADGIGKYNWIFCHNILEYTAQPDQFIRQISSCQENNGFISLIFHNPAAKIMKKAIVNKDPKAAYESIGNSKEYSAIIQTDITTYTYDQLAAWLGESHYEIVGDFGIHNIYGYVTDNEIKHNDPWHNDMMKLEFELGGQNPFKDIAIFKHIIARKRS
ncbi:S-adenosylmethionine-dependent methyltransferase [Paenibacillus antibioticophila]|uniref:S-adenosylmethionine-dependent methyltransferase n=1 Tax=Paenibacillus antibioticophila TaxID=1274374 RepID=A0A920CHI9_9BACL|nr:methyltransferase domain-containing protein [Paenibacillus antibioticophila]GIO36807.1 S-adenosylmethionine-dependent methyltransferase [Paenibacillus antibioticophila]